MLLQVCWIEAALPAAYGMRGYVCHLLASSSSKAERNFISSTWNLAFPQPSAEAVIGEANRAQVRPRKLHPEVPVSSNGWADAQAVSALSLDQLGTSKMAVSATEAAQPGH